MECLGCIYTKVAFASSIFSTATLDRLPDPVDPRSAEESLALAWGARGAGSHWHNRRPHSGGAALEGRPTDTIPHAFAGASTGQTTSAA